MRRKSQDVYPVQSKARPVEFSAASYIAVLQYKKALVGWDPIAPMRSGGGICSICPTSNLYRTLCLDNAEAKRGQ
jgi:hypothetical protein